MMDGIRMVKVDNWPVFFLQKLQNLYTRGDFTDLTLQFHTNECIKVHRLVLNTCTEYFETLIRQSKASNHMRLPPTLQSDVVVPIINFMYSGRLEFRPELHSRLYNTAKILNMQILIKLLETSVASPLKASSNNSFSPSSVKYKHLQGSAVSSVSNPSVSPKPYKGDSDGTDIVPGKRLPIWKKRSAPASSFSVNVLPRSVISEEPAKPTRFEWPEDGDSDSAPLLYSSTFDDISYDSVPIVKSINSIVQSTLPPAPSEPLLQLPQQKVMPAATFESVYQSTQPKRDASNILSNEPEIKLTKKAKVDIDEVKELAQAQEIRKGLLSEETDQSCDNADDFLSISQESEEETNSPCATQPAPSSSSQSLSTPKPILKVSESPDASKEATPSKKVRFHLEPRSQVQRLTVDSINNEPANSISSPIDNESSIEPSQSIQNECQQQASNTTSKKMMDPSGNMFEIRATTTSVKRSADGTTIQAKVPNVMNHAKIIAEVLKKYPDLVKNNRNIRLKIMQKDGSQAVSVDKSGSPSEHKPKVSYMVVKADQSMKGKTQSEPPQVQPTGVLNTKGPWLCSACQPDDPISFDTYYCYHKHLQDFHEEKLDVRMCEHCGHRVSKRNLLFYHKLKVHNIPPPQHCHFPKCDQCNYVALSDTLLIKHKNSHGPMSMKDVLCRGCNNHFKSYSLLQAHLSSGTCPLNNQNLKCPACPKLFQHRASLKSHICTDHKHLKLIEDVNDSNEEDEGEGGDEDEEENSGQEMSLSTPVSSVPTSLPSENTAAHQSQEHLSHQIIQNQTVMEVQSDVHSQGTVSIHPQTTYILPPGVTILTESAQGTLMPSTEAEALSNVASGIATSLGVADSMVVGDQGQPQTLILVDKSQVIQLPGTAGAPATQVHEYIVPDMMGNDMGQSVGLYTSGHLSQLVQYAPAASLQQPVTVSTDQGLMTIATVNANGSIVNHTVSQQTATPLMEQSLMQIPQGHLSEHNGGEIAMILTDHAYSEGIVRENGAVLQTSTVPVTMGMVPTTAVVTMVPTVSTIPETRSLLDNRPPHGMEAIVKDDHENSISRDTSVLLEATQHPSAPQPHKMAELVSDWDDDENDEGSVLPRTSNEIQEDAALPSRPTINLKSELEGSIISDNL